jgi:acyl carrier protein
MARNEKVVEAVFKAVDEVNQQLAREQHVDKSVDTVLTGPSAKLDSLGLVNFIVATEQEIEKEFGMIISLADESAMSQSKSPLTTIGALVDYISTLLE